MKIEIAGLLCSLAAMAGAEAAPAVDNSASAMQEAAAQTRTATFHLSHKQIIAHTVVEQKIDCNNRQYALQLDRQAQRMVFIVAGETHDITRTKVGHDFIHTASFGNYAFVCGPKNIVLHFFGVKITPDAPPVAVSYMAFLYDDGTVEGQQGFEVRDYKALNTIPQPTPR